MEKMHYNEIFNLQTRNMGRLKVHVAFWLGDDEDGSSGIDEVVLAQRYKGTDGIDYPIGFDARKLPEWSEWKDEDYLEMHVNHFYIDLHGIGEMSTYKIIHANQLAWQMARIKEYTDKAIADCLKYPQDEEDRHEFWPMPETERIVDRRNDNGQAHAWTGPHKNRKYNNRLIDSGEIYKLEEALEEDPDGDHPFTAEQLEKLSDECSDVYSNIWDWVRYDVWAATGIWNYDIEA